MQRRVVFEISIHAPREGGDMAIGNTFAGAGISIHAPREGGDARWIITHTKTIAISIHAPREGGD